MHAPYRLVAGRIEARASLNVVSDTISWYRLRLAASLFLVMHLHELLHLDRPTRSFELCRPQEAPLAAPHEVRGLLGLAFSRLGY